ncbi:MAG: S26 family signal peptidase [Bdellovibrionales bacterium]|nr:S26 family signal peptidase [Bdellovibrionales bacterium]
MRQFEIKIHGNSMYPILKNHDLLGVESFDKPEEIDKFAVGEVVLIRDRREWVVHRVVDFGVKATMGDWSLCIDAPTKIWGRVLTVNGVPDPLLRDKKVSLISQIISGQPMVFRKFFRVVLLLYVFLKRRGCC